MDKVVLITWLWAKEVGIEQCHSMLGDLIGEVTDHALVDWRQYIRELLVNKLDNAAPMGEQPKRRGR
uniref:Uncharacterized protein n=1 Tax=Romanomermis culicivorax TaxID=13658 RepID=A0A915K0Y2_ROMCU